MHDPGRDAMLASARSGEFLPRGVLESAVTEANRRSAAPGTATALAWAQGRAPRLTAAYRFDMDPR